MEAFSSACAAGSARVLRTFSGASSSWLSGMDRDDRSGMGSDLIHGGSSAVPGRAGTALSGLPALDRPTLRSTLYRRLAVKWIDGPCSVYRRLSEAPIPDPYPPSKRQQAAAIRLHPVPSRRAPTRAPATGDRTCTPGHSSLRAAPRRVRRCGRQPHWHHGAERNRHTKDWRLRPHRADRGHGGKPDPD